MRVLIVDDEPLARYGLRRMLENEPDVEIAGESANGRDAIRAIRELGPDLVFLDIEMPEVDGFAVVQQLPQELLPLFVFVTAHGEFALRAFEVHALDYLLKPVSEARLQKVVSRARRHVATGVKQEEGFKELVALLERERQQSAQMLERFAVRFRDRITFVERADVDRIEAADNYVRIYTHGAAHLVRSTVTAIEQRLDRREFVRVRNSTLVRVGSIREIRPLLNGTYDLLLRDGSVVRSSRRCRPAIEALIGGP